MEDEITDHDEPKEYRVYSHFGGEVTVYAKSEAEAIEKAFHKIARPESAELVE